MRGNGVAPGGEEDAALAGDGGYTAVSSSGSPRNDMRALEPSSRHLGPSGMHYRQKALVACITLLLVCVMILLGGYVGMQLGNEAVKRNIVARHQGGDARQQDGDAREQVVEPSLGLLATTTTTTRQEDSDQVTVTPAASHGHAQRHVNTTAKPTTTTRTGTSTTTVTTRTTLPPTTTLTTRTTTTTYFPTLFCYSIMRSDGYELGLVRTQLSKGVSIFACESWRVYSDVKTWLTPGPPVRLDSTVLKVGLQAKAGVKEHILNTEIFLQAWQQAWDENLIQSHEWSVKVDPDAVFFPDRLQRRLGKFVKAPGASLYFLNCKLSFELYGALEVFSKGAMEDFFKGLDRCKSDLPWTTYGEDLFMRRCFDHLGIEHVRDYGMLSDEYCAVKPFPCVADSAAFHPFKASETYFKCVAEAREADKTRAIQE
mmetsp:Transcript_99387/g.290113  ORF Transcript_99387/g.290113 Transcript_99387/m.290113 type:complete len:427 (-) Transcript_99387:207-1487(-)